MSGHLAIIGTGPGDPGLLAPRAAAALADATDLIGYGPYLDRIPERTGQTRHASDNRVELDRARLALHLAASGHRVAVVSAGDAGVFGMAAAVFEAVDADPQHAGLEIEVIPGISALLAAAARLGAPLGHDFCAISLSDNLKPWPTVLARLRAVAEAGFVMALYNPISRARPWQLGAAFEALRAVLPGQTPVAFATAISRADERVEILSLADADPLRADMRTLVMVGTAATRSIARPGGGAWLYTPRSAA
ncbi:precorrin-3B C(17)-methyltransferase [Acidisphaera sp. L21]|uniref:precorrin-3B C(17)-methyltransferase n=1 Tax=Acidisphaera sp. L21 TaxID=1641851 RepID=UPI00131E768C|nr:precorrin-3B C(17)-methyltransferase [Acidisphaera sp. L21]